MLMVLLELVGRTRLQSAAWQTTQSHTTLAECTDKN
jgi:hypothetical protein